MVAIEHNTLLVLLLVLVLGLALPEITRKFKLPLISALILVGAVFGPNALGYVSMNPTIFFFGFLGSAFLMLMAGLEIKIEHIRAMRKSIGTMAAFNGIIPFITGTLITKFFGYSWFTSLLIGTIFISSSVAIVIASVKSAKIEKTRIGESIISSSVILDMLSLFLLAVLLQSVSPITTFPLPIYFAVLLLSVYLLKRFLPPIAKYFLRYFMNKTKHRGEYEDQLHFVLVLLIGILLYFSGLGVHPIVAAFIVGLLLSDVISSEQLLSKIHAMGYGLFVPVFFFIIGMEMDFSIFTHFDYRNLLMISLIIGSIASKFISGYIAGRIVRFSQENSMMFGISSTSQLTTTLAVTYAAASMGILDATLITTILALSIITTFAAPVLLNLIAEHKKV